MKSAFELAMERFGGPLKQYTDEQKAQLAEVEKYYEAQIAQAKFAAQARVEKAAGDAEAIRQANDDLLVELRSLEEKRDRKKQQVLWREVLRQKVELLPLVWFEPEFAPTLAAEEWRYWLCIVRKLPERIRYRSLSLRDHPQAW